MELTIFIILISSAFAVFFGVKTSKLCKRLKKRKYARFVLHNSFALKKLLEINARFSFYTPTISYDDHYTYDNENFFNSISCEDYLIYQLQYNKYKVQKEIDYIEYNNRLFERYKKELSTINDFGSFSSPIEKLNKDFLLIIEKNIFEQNKLKPVLTFDIKITLACSTLNGYIYNKKSESFSSTEILLFIKRLNNKTRDFYNDREVWDALCRVERGRVSNKMRFSIYKRDGYRCQICGRTDATDYLEIDHIKPIAKGGKSTYDNLQTLCRKCNKEKGDRYY